MQSWGGRLIRHGGLAIAILGVVPANANVFTATSSNLASVMAMAQGGNTIILSGAFPETTLRNLNYTTPLLLDATAAVFAGGMTLSNVRGITLQGGVFGSSTALTRTTRGIDVNGGGNVRVVGATFLGPGQAAGTGILMRNLSGASLENSSFSGLRLGAGFTNVSASQMLGNVFTRQTSDGMNVVDSDNVLVSGNICRDFTPSSSAHPDCLQMWTTAGLPLQEYISVIGNQAYGPTQGFTSFDPSTASGRFFRFENNVLVTSYPQGIACYGCFDSVIINNQVGNTPDARFRTSINVVGGANNLVTGNVLTDNRTVARSTAGQETLALDAAATTNTRLLSSIDIYGAITLPRSGLVIDGDALNGNDNSLSGGELPDQAFAFGQSANAVAAVPEPANWVHFLLGFGALGMWQRQRQRQPLAA